MLTTNLSSNSIYIYNNLACSSLLHPSLTPSSAPPFSSSLTTPLGTLSFPPCPPTSTSALCSSPECRLQPQLAPHCSFNSFSLFFSIPFPSLGVRLTLFVLWGLTSPLLESAFRFSNLDPCSDPMLGQPREKSQFIIRFRMFLK